MKGKNLFSYFVYSLGFLFFFSCENEDSHLKNRKVSYSIDYIHSGEGVSNFMEGKDFSAVEIVEKITNKKGFQQLEFVVPEGRFVMTGLPALGGSTIVYTKTGLSKGFTKSVETNEALIKILEDAFYMKEADFQKKYEFNP